MMMVEEYQSTESEFTLAVIHDYISSPESQQFTVDGTTTRVTPNWLTTKRSQFAFVTNIALMLI